ncbi:MAG: ISL3 family transposase [Planctomycetaceae bacterium]
MQESLREHYARLLGLSTDWRVDAVELELERKRVTIALQFVASQGDCPECGTPSPIYDRTAERTWRHLDTMQFETLITARTPRCRCPHCGVKTVTLPWTDKHSRFTLLFEAFAIDVLQAAASVSAAAALLRLSWDEAHAIMRRAVERGLNTRKLTGVKRVGLDEKSFKRGQNYVTTLTDLDGARVLDVAPGRSEEATQEVWKSLSKRQRKGLQAVAIDMWQAYENSVRLHAPQADIVHDKFHVAKHLNEAVDKVRRQEHKRLKAQGDGRLTGTRQLLLFSPEKLNEEKSERLEALRRESLQTSRAWGLKDYFRWFWTHADAASGKEFFEDWYAWAIRSRLKPMKQVARMLKNRLRHLLTWFQHRITNSMSEGFNSVIQTLKANARGFRNFDNYRTRILFFCGKLQLKPPQN